MTDKATPQLPYVTYADGNTIADALVNARVEVVTKGKPPWSGTPRRYRITVEDLTPPPDEPQWWNWDEGTQDWGPISTPGRTAPSAYEDGSVVVWATAADREEKRQIMLEAQRKAGKP